jgi:hypothetical protein
VAGVQVGGVRGRRRCNASAHRPPPPTCPPHTSTPPHLATRWVAIRADADGLTHVQTPSHTFTPSHLDNQVGGEGLAVRADADGHAGLGGDDKGGCGGLVGVGWWWSWWWW